MTSKTSKPDSDAAPRPKSGSKTREAARELLKNHMRADAVIAMGFTEYAVYNAKRKLKKGWRPEDDEELAEDIFVTADGNGNVSKHPLHPPLAGRVGGDIATVVGRRPAPIIFTIGKAEIALDAQKLYESYILYLDLQGRAGISDSFSAVLLDAMGFVWRNLVARPRVVNSQVIVEVK